MSEVETHIKEWIQKVSKIRPELGGFAICPYALHAKFTIISIENDKIDDISLPDKCDIVFFVLSDDFTLEKVQEIVEKCNSTYPEWEFFEDCASYDTFVGGIQTNNGKYNLILAQPREKLKNLRLKLAKTDYYKNWTDEYLKEILQDDYNVIKNMITG